MLLLLHFTFVSPQRLMANLIFYNPNLTAKISAFECIGSRLRISKRILYIHCEPAEFGFPEGWDDCTIHTILAEFPGIVHDQIIIDSTGNYDIVSSCTICKCLNSTYLRGEISQ